MAVTVLQATKLHLQQSFGLNESRFQEWRTNKKQVQGMGWGMMVGAASS